jgi:hypothetical protein
MGTSRRATTIPARLVLVLAHVLAVARFDHDHDVGTRRRSTQGIGASPAKLKA